jgi:hypothetical protein
MALTPPDILILGSIKFATTNVTEYYSSPGSNYDGVNLTYNSQFEINPQITGYPDNITNYNTFNANDIEVGFKYILPSGKMYDVVGVDVYDDYSASVDLRDTELREYLNSTEDPPSNYPEDGNYGIFVSASNGVAQLNNLSANTNYFPSDAYWITDLLGTSISDIDTTGETFPYTGSAQITGSLDVVGNIKGTTLNGVLISTGSGTSNHNFAVGVYSLYFNTTGNYNIAQGFQSMFNNTLGNYNVAQGFNSLFQNTNGSNNVALGYKAGYRAFGLSNNNVYIGSEAGPISQTVESNKLYIANSNGVPLIGGDFATKTVTISGSLEVKAPITGSLFGTASYASSALTSSNALTASYVLNAVSSSYALSSSLSLTSSYASSSTSASYALTASYFSGSVTSASYALSSSYALNGGVTQIIAGNNILIDNGGSGSVTITASGGGAVFPYTGSAAITGSLVVTGSINGLNIGLGQAGTVSNVAIGVDTLADNTLGYYNVAIGAESLTSNTEGILNTSIGGEALTNNTVGVENTAVGVMALSSNIEGDNNVAVGNLSLFNVKGDNNTALGHSAGTKATGSSTGNVYVGRSAGPSSNVIENNKLYIANAEGIPLIGGDFTAKTVTISGSLDVKGAISGSIESASYALNSTSASYALTASYFSGSIESASYALNSTSASYALTASYYDGPVVSASYALTASHYSGSVVSSSYALTASYATNAGASFPYTGSAVITGSLVVTGSIKSTQGFTGSLQGNADTSTSSSYALNSTSASYSLTASYAENAGDIFPYTGSAGILGTLDVTGGITGRLNGTASYADSAAYALNIADQGFAFTQSISAMTWSIQHNLGTDIPLVNIYTADHFQMIPAEIIGIDGNTTEVHFDPPQDGYAIVSKGSGISAYAISASYAATSSYVVGKVQVENNTDTASSINVGSIRYRTSGNNSYVDMVMQTGASTYEWVNIVQNNW